MIWYIVLVGECPWIPEKKKCFLLFLGGVVHKRHGDQVDWCCGSVLYFADFWSSTSNNLLECVEFLLYCCGFCLSLSAVPGFASHILKFCRLIPIHLGLPGLPESCFVRTQRGKYETYTKICILLLFQDREGCDDTTYPLEGALQTAISAFYQLRAFCKHCLV